MAALAMRNKFGDAATKPVVVHISLDEAHRKEIRTNGG
jgi:hypothetical protein